MLSVLEDLIPAKYRKYVVYILIPLAVVVYGVWQASNGDWSAFWPALVPAIIGWLVAAPNTHPEPERPAVPPYDVADQPDPEALPPTVTTEQAIAARSNAVGSYHDDFGSDDEEVEA